MGPFEPLFQCRAREQVLLVLPLGPAGLLFAGSYEPFPEAAVLADPLAQFAPVADECVVDELRHRLCRRSFGRAGGDDALPGQLGEDRVDRIAVVGRTAGAGCEVS